MKKRSLNKKRAKRRMRSFFVKVITGLVIVSAVIIFLVIMNSAKVKTSAGVNTGNKYYKSVMVKHGDTLWSIASENTGDGQEDVRKLMQEIKDINGLERDDITYGASLIVPYYGN